MFTQSCIFVRIPNKWYLQVISFSWVLAITKQTETCHTQRNSAQNTQWQTEWMNDCFRRKYQVMEKLLTRMSSFPLSSRVQCVLGTLPSRRVCLQVILFSVSHVTRLCGQLHAISQQPFEDEHLYLHVLHTRITFIFFSEEFFCPFALELWCPLNVKAFKTLIWGNKSKVMDWGQMTCSTSCWWVTAMYFITLSA